jgi:hypothetical protein
MEFYDWLTYLVYNTILFGSIYILFKIVEKAVWEYIKLGKKDFEKKYLDK